MASDGVQRVVQALMQTWPARAVQGMYEGATLPGDVYRGNARVPQSANMPGGEDTSSIGRVTDLAGGVMGGAYGMAPPIQNGYGMGIRAYHGSPHNFDRFDIRKAGKTTDPGELGEAVYFTTDPRMPASATHRYEVNAEIASPLNLSMPDFRTQKRDIIRDALGLPPTATAKEITQAARARGHDSVVLDYSPTGYAQKEIAVFDDKLIDILKKTVAGLAND